MVVHKNTLLAFADNSFDDMRLWIDTSTGKVVRRAQAAQLDCGRREGDIAVAGCLSTMPGCPLGGEMTAVWVRDAAAMEWANRRTRRRCPPSLKGKRSR